MGFIANSAVVDGKFTRQGAELVANGVRYVVATMIALLLPSQHSHVDIAKLAFFALCVTTFFLFATPMHFPGGAEHFPIYAQALVDGSKLDPSLAQRDAGYPLLLLLSGYPATGSFIGITLINAAFAVLMPILIYLPLSRYSRGVAYYCSILLIVSLAPILFMKWIHHDQTYVFAIVLLTGVLIGFLQYRDTARLYGFTAAAIATSLSRQAANLVFPVFLAIAFCSRREKYLHYVLSIALFVLIAILYSWHRYEIFDVSHQKSLPSYTGQQIVYNVYINSMEFGIRLSPDIGPNFAEITKALDTAVRPSPRESSFVQRYVGSIPTEFAEQHILKYSADELMQKVFEIPNYEYYTMWSAAEPNDQVYVKAWFEIVKAHPLYFLEVALRNAIVYAFNPGYVHSRYNTNPFGREGLYFPPSAAIGGRGKVGAEGALNSISAEAQREVLFDPLSESRPWARTLFLNVGQLWVQYYDALIRVTSIFMAVAWLTLLIVLVPVRLRSPRLRQFYDRVATDDFMPSMLAASALFFYDVAITAAFVEPDYRHHHFILSLRILIAGFGLVVLQRLLFDPEIGLARQVMAHRIHQSGVCALAAIRRNDLLARDFANQKALLAVLVGSIVFGMFAVWAGFQISFVS